MSAQQRFTSARRGFTLLELVVASALILSITSVTLAIMMTTYFTQIESQIRNATTRDCQLVLDTIGEDLRYLGAGVPYGTTVNRAIAPETAASGQLRPALRVAETHYLAFVGDLPYPNAEVNGFAVTSDLFDNTPVRDAYAVSSEVSGCVPPDDGTVQCDTSAMSPIWGGAGPSDCDASNTTSRTCPWALGKWQTDWGGAVDLVVTAPTGIWGLVRWDMSTFKNDNGTVMIRVETDYPANNAELLRRRPFFDSRAGASTVSQLDRVFYSLERVGAAVDCDNENCLLWRRQCWGPLGLPSFTNFPAAGVTGAAAGRSNADPGNCGAGVGVDVSGTRWEQVTGGISALTFKYFDETGAPIAAPIAAPDLASVASIEVEVAVTRRAQAAFAPAQKKVMTQRMTRRYYLEGYGPWVSSFDCEPGPPAGSGTQAAASNCAFRGRP